MTFTLKGGEKAEFSNLPVGTGFTVSEESKDADGYETTVSAAGGTVNSSDKTVTGSISATAAVTASYVNTKNTVKKEATKQWKSGEEIIAWPADIENVTVTLYAKIQGSEAAVKISDASISGYFNGIDAEKVIDKNTTDHKAAWENLPARIFDGREWKDVEYSVQETKITYVKTAEEETQRVVVPDIPIPAGEGDIITNQAEVIDVNAKKAWLNKDGKTTPPEGAKVTFTLLADGAETNHSVELNGVDETDGGKDQKTGDYEGADWTAYFTGLPKYNKDTGALITYTVKETGTWNGYKIEGNDTVNSGGTITNKEITFSLNILKVDSGNHNIKLKGAVFTLNMINGKAGADSIIGGTSQEKSTNDDGEATFDNLSVGYYKVEETQTPEGYLITGESVFYIEVNETGIVLLKKGTGSPESWEKNAEPYGNVITFTVTAGNAAATVVNDAGEELPHTGGSGTMIYTVIGTILITAAGILLLRRKRNEMMN